VFDLSNTHFFHTIKKAFILFDQIFLLTEIVKNSRFIPLFIWKIYSQSQALSKKRKSGVFSKKMLIPAYQAIP